MRKNNNNQSNDVEMIFMFGKRICLYMIRYGNVEVEYKMGDDDMVSTTIK